MKWMEGKKHVTLFSMDKKLITYVCLDEVNGGKNM